MCRVNESPKIIALLAFNNFPLWEKCFNGLNAVVDGFVVHFDNKFISSFEKEQDGWDIMNHVINHPRCISSKILPFNNSNGWSWRESLLRELDIHHADVVVTLDIDERFENLFDARLEIKQFYNSDKRAMMFDYNRLKNENGDLPDTYPSLPHMKVFKWEDGLSYEPYYYFAQISNYACKPNLIWHATERIDHYCMWTNEMREKKMSYVIGKYGKL